MTKARILANLGAVTSSATELNTLDGVPATLTATELGYSDGVTSAVQTQLTAKAPLASPAFTGTPTGITAAHLEAGVLPSDVTGGSGLNLAGIKNADAWRISASFVASVGYYNYMTANWERDDVALASQTVGTGMTQSSGVFTFPSTGIWWLTGYAFINTGVSGNFTGLVISFTTNNSSYTPASESYGNVDVTGKHDSIFTSTFLDVTDVSNVKVKMAMYIPGSGANAIGFAGGTGSSYTGLNFIRLGDT